MSHWNKARLAVKVARAVAARRPFLLYYKPTGRCDLRCRICSRWESQHGREEELDLPTVRGMLRDFSAAGAAILTLWGGEPLLRDDVGEILAAAKELGFRTSMCTNGRRLAARAADVVPHLDVLLCSLDGHGELHDELRGVPGAYQHVVEGIVAAKAAGARQITVWASVHRRNVDHLDRLAEVARELEVDIEFFPIGPVPGHNDDLVLDGETQRRAFEQVLDLKRSGLPVRNSDHATRLLMSAEEAACNLGPAALQVDHDGLVHSCEAPDGTPLRVWGHFSKLDLSALVHSPGFRAARTELRRCGRCRLPCVVELAGSLPSALIRLALR